MKKAFKKLWNDDRGNMLVIAGAALPMLIGAAGLANDTIQWALWKRELQRAADSAAIAGVYDRVATGNTTTAAGAVNRDLEINHHTGIGLSAGYPKVTFPADTTSNRQQVAVELAVAKRLAFSSLFMKVTPTIKARATAASVPGSDSYCVVSLEKTSKTGIMGSGNTDVEMTCGMITNSVAANAAAAKGSASVSATVIAAVGGIQESAQWHVGKYDPYVPAQADPYANLEPSADELATCAGTQPALSAPATVDLASDADHTACYSSISVGSNKTMTLSNGLFLVDGGSVDIQGRLNLVNATIVLTNKTPGPASAIGSFDMNAQGTINATAPTSGKWAGMAIYQDRRALDPQALKPNLDAGSPNKINGGSGAKIQGVLYFPNQQLTYNGDGTGGFVCTQFVVRRVIFGGNNTTKNQFTDDCAGAGMGKIQGGRKVRLVA